MLESSKLKQIVSGVLTIQEGMLRIDKVKNINTNM